MRIPSEYKSSGLPPPLPARRQLDSCRLPGHDEGCRPFLALPRSRPITGGAGTDPMQTTLNAAVESYLRVKTLSRGTRNAYLTTLRKWEPWGGDTPIEELRRKDIREFLDWSTNVPSRMKRRIPAALRIKPKSTCVPSFRGLGNRNLLRPHRFSERIAGAVGS